VLVRDYRAHLTARLLHDPPSPEKERTWLQQFLYEYVSLLDFYDRFRGPKKMIYFEELLQRPDDVAAALAGFYGLPDREEGLARWRMHGRDVQARFGRWCAEADSVRGGCGAPCRNFMKLERTGPFAAPESTTPRAGARGPEVAASAPPPATPAPTWWNDFDMYVPKSKQPAPERVSRVVREFEALLCLDAPTPSTVLMKTPRLARKYLQRRGWGSGSPPRCGT